MGSGKRNYRALRFVGRKKKQTILENKMDKEPKNDESVKELLGLWERSKNKER